MKSIPSLLPLALLALGACSSMSAPATPPGVVGMEVPYDVGGTVCKGYLAYDENRAGPRPGVLIVHEWWGHNDYVRRRAEMLAAEGYTAFALDMYGDGKQAAHPDDAGKFATAVMKNLPVGVERFAAARRVLAQQPETDANHIAAIGYCFGGSIVLEMVRRGEVLDLAASFHGNLAPQGEPAKPGSIKTKVVLACHGAADKLVPIEQVDALGEEILAAGGRTTTVVYPNAMHGFTNPDATAKGKQFGLPLAYDAVADKESWEKLLELLRRTTK